ncbi:hypothetical protein [Enterobacter hormaechei]|uniref:hypothetical protein n=1 Tax=Enterobacter hormaechei TaxID=158836 RepID=UPI000735617E|nr:hypothetical protein [Enterobacter hormaechei]CAE7591319.1 hypothetical protein AI2760V1_1144 [Enterobacter cloacae]KTJ42726.1 hypothetical protein ASU83_11265 [Enterobacter hormaechei subsp. xiangfangensis]CAF2181514.1 hypothetical protein AI2747V1_1146 [Enterobacter cloacae]CAH3906821.1 hypothetical protein AI2760V1_1144 [Enterobacter cloacae]CAH4990555.1 hypothetical protein AI2747V1_1146 [Enterobacter cloacae]
MSNIDKHAVQAVADLKAGYTLGNADVAILNELARIALASLEAEAVGEVVLGEYDDCGCHPDAKVVCIAADGQADWENFKDGTRLYTAPPAPVSVPDGVLKILLPDAEKSEFWFEHDGKILFEGVKFNNAVFDACRAAMLQGAGRPQNEPQNIPENIPATQFKPVADLYGLTSPTGGETSFTFDAVEARDFIDGGWSCQEYVELGRFQEALTDHSEGDLDMVRPVMFIDGNLLPGDAEKLKAAIEELNHSGEPTIMIAGDSPVIPDGWVMVPEDPTHEMLEAGDEQFGTYDVYRRMIEAAPKLE